MHSLKAMKYLVVTLTLAFSIQPSFAMKPSDIKDVLCQASLQSILNELPKITPKGVQVIREQVEREELPRQVADLRILVRDLELTFATTVVSKGHLLKFAPQLLQRLKVFEELGDDARVNLAGIYDLKERLMAVIRQDANVHMVASRGDADDLDNRGISKIERAMFNRDRVVTQNLAWLKDAGFAAFVRFVTSIENNEATLSFFTPPQF